MTDQERNSRLKKLCRTIALCSASVPMPEWPPYVIEADSYLQKYYFVYLYNLLKKARSKNLSWENIGNVLNPSRVSQIMHSIYGLSSSGLKDYEKRDLVDSLISIIGTRRIDPFCDDNKNILFSQSEAENHILRAKIVYKEEDKNWIRTSQLLSRINALLFSLCDLMHVCQHASSHEFHGPYILDNSQIIFREYYDLKPIEVWPIFEKLTISSFSTIEIYQDVDIQFSFFNHIIPSSSLPSHLTGVNVSKTNEHNECYSMDELDEIHNELIILMKDFTKEVNSFQKPDWIRKYIEMHYFVLKPLAILVDEDWHPSKEQIDLIRTQPDMKAASAFRILNGLSFDERIVALENLYNGFLF